MVDLPACHDIQRLGVQLITDALLIRTCGRDQEIQRLLSGITGALGQNILQLPVRLGMYLVQDESRNVQAVFGADLGRENLVESSV